MAHRHGAEREGAAASGAAVRACPAGGADAAGGAGHSATPFSAPPSRLYVVATWVPRRTTITVGSLGPVTFARGWYAYVGSARRARGARVARHLRAEKPLRWHADHLFARYPGRRAWLVDGDLSECELAGALAGLPGAERRPPRFGAGDCRCAGHLVALPGRPTQQALAALLPPSSRVSSYRRAGCARVSRP